ncbi:uncharacterized protein [Diadema antillarum]|uniref:uncharacterized protein n=1 Tax=Diadema antillarum TaxID=105358 RepID=UPI003A870071
MMRHSAAPAETGVFVHEPETDDDLQSIPVMRRHRPVTALVRRRSSKLAQLVQSVVDNGGIQRDDDEPAVEPKLAKRSASAPHRMSITSFYADDSEFPAHREPEKIDDPLSVLRARRNSTQEIISQTYKRRTSMLRPPPKPPRTSARPKTAFTKNTLPGRQTRMSAKNQRNETCADEEENKSDSESDADSDSSLSTLESLVELKKRVDEIVGTRPVHASRAVRRGSATNIPRVGMVKKERSEMVPESVIRRRPAMISIERRSKSMSNVLRTRERVTVDVNGSPQGSLRGRSASVAENSPLLPPRGRRMRITRPSTSAKRSQQLKRTDANSSPGVQMFESRRVSISGAFSESNGDVSYKTRKNMRRGSLFAADTRSPSRLGEGEDDIRRDSLIPPEDLLSGIRGSFEDIRRGSATSASRRRTPIPGDMELSVPDRISVKLARERFRRIARLVLNCVKICRRSYLNIEEEKSEYMSFIQVGTRADDNGDRLFFDPDYFKADKSQRLSEDTKRILTEHPHKRTDKELKYVQIALRNIKAFAEYPIRMQGRLCKVGWLETYGPSRAILRQGHPPHAFYFILSGTLVVTIFTTNGPKGKPCTQTVAFLRRGQSFGELAILNETVRASTVITKSRCELLVISVQDFQDIFMVSGGIKSVNDPDQSAFLTSLRFLTLWPIHILPQRPKDCLFHFFATGDVLVQDSNQSDWIYIVKSGSCSVIKKLKSVSENVDSAYMRKNVSMAWEKGTMLGARLGITGTDAPKSPARKKSRGSRRKSTPGSSAGKSHDDTSNTSSRGADSSAIDFSLQGHGSETSSVLAAVTRKGDGVYLKTGSQGSSDGRNDSDNEAGDENEELDENTGLPKNFVDQRRTFHTDLDAAKATGPRELTEADKHPMFVTIQLLLKGGVFGVNNIVFPDQPSLSLVSNGAECIMIKKQFYLEHATEDTLSLLRKNEFPYPTEEQLQEKLQKHMNWNAYKDHTVKSVVFESRAHRTQQLRVVHR